MRKVQFTISKEDITKRTFARTYELIRLEFLDLNANYEKLLENCKELDLISCRFENMAHLAHLLVGCKKLKFLQLINPELAAYGPEGLEAVESCANHCAIDLVFELYDIRVWVVLRMFKIIQLDIGRLKISDRCDMCDIGALEIADMMDYVHHNHKSVFDHFEFEYSTEFNEKIMSTLFFSQIKQLTSLSILSVHSEEVLNGIAKNLTELKNLSISLEIPGGGENSFNPAFNLNGLKALTKLETLDIELELDEHDGGLISLYVRELQQLKTLEVRNFNIFLIHTGFSESVMRLQLPDLTPQLTLNSMENLRISGFFMTRNMFQLVCRTMPKLQDLFIKNLKPNRSYLHKRLALNKNEIRRLKDLETLSIDNFWIDESFLRNMKLPQLQSFSLLSNDTISFSELSNIGLFYLAKQCPKLMEIRAEVRNEPVVVIASRKTADCEFHNQEEANEEDGDGEYSDYSENDLE
jgi:hypothetical protein